MNKAIVKTIASGITSTLLTSMVATWYIIQELFGDTCICMVVAHIMG